MNVNKDSNRKYIIATVCLIHLLLGLDINIVSVSLPTLAEHFNVNAGIVTRVVWVYFLVLTGFLLIFGKIGDLKGFKNIYLGGIFTFTLGSLLSAFAPDINLLVVFRVIQAAGGSVLFALTPAIITAYVPAEKRGKVFGLNYSFTALGGIIGRALSGFLLESFGWNSIFLINIPIGIFAAYLGYKYLVYVDVTNEKRKFDYAGSILIFLALLLLLYVINSGQQLGWLSIQIISILILSVILFLLFALRQKSFEFPLFNLSILKSRKILLPVLAFALVYIITNGMIFLFPFFLQWVKGFPKTEIGLIMAVASVMQMFSGYFAGSLSDKKNIRMITLSGAVLAFFSYAIFIFLSPSSGYIFIISSIILYGIAIGVFIPANTNRIMSYAKDDEKGSVSGFMVTIVRLGSALGVCFFGAIFSAFVPQQNPVQSNVPVANIMQGFQFTFLFGAVVAISLVIISYFMEDKKSK